MSDSKASPRPWRTMKWDEGHSLLDSSASGDDLISDEGVLSEPDAQLIVRAVNSHDLAVEIATFLIGMQGRPYGSSFLDAAERIRLLTLARKFQEMDRE